MKREMCKKDRQMSEEEVIKACKSANHGILAMNGDDGYPYAVPVNYVYDDGKLYIHSAEYGYKKECIERNDKVCFTAIINARVEPSKFTAAYRSIVATGRISKVEDEAEKRRILEQFIYNMSPDFIEGGMKFINAAIGKTLLLCIDVEELTGKQSMADTFDVE